MKNKYFGTDGIRGTVNQGNITGEKSQIKSGDSSFIFCYSGL